MITQIVRLITVVSLAALPLILLSCSEDVNQLDTTPPSVSLIYPLPDDTVSSQTPLRAIAHDVSGITVVRFYVDDYLVAEDCCEPYDQVWYSGYWEDGTYYNLKVETEDRNGNVGSSVPITVYIANGSQFMLQLISPSDGQVLQVGKSYSWVWDQVPGAEGYIMKLRLPGTSGAFYQGCDSIEFETCYQYIKGYSIERTAGGPTTTPLYWSVRAYWDVNHMTPWSMEWSVSSE